MPDIHLPIGTSSVHRLIGCPASLSRSKKAPQGKTSAPAEEGTMLHTVMENVYQDDAKPVDMVGDTFNAGLVLTHTMVDDQISPAIEATEKLLDEVDADELILEKFVQYEPDLAGGTLDMVAVSADEKTVLLNDYKFGYNGVEVVGNMQLLMAALSGRTDPQTKDVFVKAEKFIGAITQPKALGNTAATWEFTHADVDAFEEQLIDAMDLSEAAEPPAHSGSHCKYCAAAPFCDEKKLEARAALILTPTNTEHLVQALAVVDEVEAWVKDVRKAAHDLLERGASVPGFKLVQKRASRVWTDPTAVEDKIRKAKRIKLEQGFNLKLKSPAQLEKLCKELKYPFKDFAAMQASVSSGTTLAKESDKRPAVAQKVIPDSLLKLVEGSK
jgi:hypothetical protein